MHDDYAAVTRCIITTVLLALTAHAETGTAEERRDGLSEEAASIQIEAYLFRLAEDVSAGKPRHAARLDEWLAHRERARRRLLYMVGLDPLPERTPLNVKITRTIDKPDFTVECIYFESLPKFLVTANLYLPKSRTGPLPTIVYLCGHAGGPAGSKGHYRHHPIWYAQNGYACLIVDPIQHSEIPGRHNYTHRGKGWENFSTGYTPAGIEIWNAVRALDYLWTRDEIDKERIGITGRSGGGTFSYFTAAVDDRIKAIVSDHATYTVANHITADTLRTHCDCNFFVNVDRFCSVDYCALLAPRPLLLQCSTDDGNFPPKGYRDFFAAMKRVYELYGKGGQIRIVEVPGPHKDIEPFQSNAMNFFSRWLLDRATDLKVDREAVLTVMPDEGEPRVWPDEKQRPKTFINEEINRLLVPTYKQRYAGGNRPVDRPEMVRLLAENVFVNWPQRKCPLRAELLERRVESGVEHCRYLFESEEGLRILAEISLPAKRTSFPHAILWISDGPDDPLEAEIDALRGKQPVVRVYPRGLHGSRWDSKINIFVRRAMSVLGQTVDSARVYDVARAIDLLQAVSHGCGERMTVIGAGKLGVLGMYAAMMDGRIRRVVVREPTLTHYESPILPNVLRYTDVPLTAAYLPPTELIILGDEPEEFGQAKQRFARLGMPDRYRVVKSLAEVFAK
jgi:cephalosporin-C deacetylase-like acetyl esterase